MLDRVVFLQNFLPVFLGVILSFLFWFGGQKFLRHQRNQKAKTAMLREIEEEIAINICILDTFISTAQQMMASSRVPVCLFSRMKMEVYQYIMTSGDIRLINDKHKRDLILSAGFVCSKFNEFVDNTESLLVMVINHPNGLHLAKIRLKGIIEQAEEDKRTLIKYHKQLQQQAPFEEKNMGESSEHNRETVKLLGELKETIKWSHLSSLGISVMALVIGLTSISIATQNSKLLNVCLWLIAVATIYNLGILIYFAVKAIQKRRRAAPREAKQ